MDMCHTHATYVPWILDACGLPTQEVQGAAVQSGFYLEEGFFLSDRDGFDGMGSGDPDHRQVSPFMFVVGRLGSPMGGATF